MSKRIMRGETEAKLKEETKLFGTLALPIHWECVIRRF
jgi:hypothetical protein